MVRSLASVIRPAMKSFYAIAGRSFCIAADDVGVARLVSRALRDYQFIPTGADPGGAPTYTIRISAQDSPPSIPKGLASFEVPFGLFYTFRVLPLPMESRLKNYWLLLLSLIAVAISATTRIARVCFPRWLADAVVPPSFRVP